MAKIYFTLTGTRHYYGSDFFKKRHEDSVGKTVNETAEEELSFV